jgi:hypothetical protein
MTAKYKAALNKLCSVLTASDWVVSGDPKLDSSIKVSHDGKTWIKINTGGTQ